MTGRTLGQIFGSSRLLRSFENFRTVTRKKKRRKLILVVLAVCANSLKLRDDFVYSGYRKKYCRDQALTCIPRVQVPR